MRAIGKLLQLGGLVLLPVAMVLELTGSLNRNRGVADMLIMMIFGLSAFYLGRFIEGYSTA